MSEATPAAPTPRILVVDDEPDLREIYALTLIREGWEVAEAAGVAEARALLEQGAFDVAIVDMRLRDGEGMELLSWLAARHRAERVVMATAYGNAATAVQALKTGAFDYLTKPVDLRQLRQVVRSALALGAAVERARPTPALHALVGDSPPMRAVKDALRRAARGMAPVLIQGESGTGKELAARALHELSNRAAGPFVPVNCSAIPEHLLEAEFFGYRKGAFTGAVNAHDGFFAAAAGGTLFLDEIGELPLAMQAKLLRAVQERRVRVIGETAETPVDARLVSATHRDLARCVADGSFRQDLYYRLNVIGVTLPPLRDRLDDLPQLADALLARIRRDQERPALRLGDEALAALSRQSFGGNVRELENMLQRAAALAASDTIGADDLGAPAAAVTAPGERAAAAGATPPQAAMELPPDLPAYLDHVERAILLEALRRTRFNRTAAAHLLGLNLRQMRYRIERLGIRDDDAR